jgi:glycosyltransferase involved in cell wall biosynthesis
MPNRLPLVSVVTSTYKQAKYLRKTIDSVLTQDYSNIEYLVINDGSPDGTEDILKAYGNQFYWETQPNQGEPSTLNKAIRMAKGNLIAKLSSDDYLYPNAISVLVEQFLQHPELVVVYSDFDIVDEEGRLVTEVQKPDYNFVGMIRNHLCLPGPGALFRKEIFEKLNGFDTQFKILFDMHFWWRAGLIGPFARVPKSLSAFRQHTLSQSSTGGEKMAEETIRCVENFYSLPNLPKTIIKAKAEAFSNAYFSAGTQYFLRNKDLSIHKTYLRKSFMMAPYNYFRPSNRGKLITFIDVMISPKIIPFIKKVVKKGVNS